MTLFLYTGISKLIDHKQFKETIADSPILAPSAALIAWGLPLLELGVILLLIIPRWRLKGLYVSLTLMICFTGYVMALLIFDKKLPCSCGGILQQLSWPQHLVFNGIFILLACLAIKLQKKEKKNIRPTGSTNTQLQILNIKHHIKVLILYVISTNNITISIQAMDLERQRE